MVGQGYPRQIYPLWIFGWRSPDNDELRVMRKNIIADLRAVAPGDFVSARNALAARLKEEGKVAEARQVRRLRRPSPVVWALNNSASAPREVGALADAVADLRRAQLGQRDFRPAMDRLRAAIAPLMRSASEKLRLARIPMSPVLERRLRDTLIASVADRGLRADLLAGRLTEERGAAGFDILAKGPIPAVSPRAKARKERRPAERRRQLKADRESREGAKRAQREVRALNRVAEAKARAADTAAAKVEAMRAALLEQERRTADLQRAATEAREAAREAQRVHALSSAK